MKKVYKNTVLNIGAQVFVLLVMVLAMPWIVRGLGEVAFAILSLVWTVITYFTLWDLGIGRAVTKFVAEKRGAGKSDEINSAVQISTIISFGLGIFFGVLILAFDSQLTHLLFNIPSGFEPTVRTTVMIVSISMPILLLQSSFRGVIMGFDRFDFSNMIQILNGILQWGGIRKKLNMCLLREILSFGGWAMVSAIFFRYKIVAKAILAIVSLLLYALIVFRFWLEDNEKRILTGLVPRRTNA